MKLMKLPIALIAMCLIPTALMAQTKIGVIDMEQAVVGCAEGQKAAAKFNARGDELSKDLDRRKKEIEDAQNKLKTQDKILSPAAKADLTKNIERMQTDLTRITDDANKELEDLKTELLKPIAEYANQLVSAYSAQMGYTLLIDTSSQQNQSLLYYDPALDVTAQVIKIIDAQMAKQPVAAPKAAAPKAPAPKTTTPAAAPKRPAPPL